MSSIQLLSIGKLYIFFAPVENVKIGILQRF